MSCASSVLWRLMPHASYHMPPEEVSLDATFAPSDEIWSMFVPMASKALSWPSSIINCSLSAAISSSACKGNCCCGKVCCCCCCCCCCCLRISRCCAAFACCINGPEWSCFGCVSMCTSTRWSRCSMWNKCLCCWLTPIANGCAQPERSALGVTMLGVSDPRGSARFLGTYGRRRSAAVCANRQVTPATHVPREANSLHIRVL
mmetsp:Transcript_96952/g.279012  ORF Transcript_96952/g.279012 Transcript_96952/m.279012 type:complete len:203 (+) Transcript_96952:297-905(+)